MYVHDTISNNCKKKFYSNLLIPSGFKMTKTHLAKYSITIYKGETINYLFDNGLTWLSIDFGEASEVISYKNIT